MLDSLLIADKRLTKLVSLTVAGVHTEQAGSRNRAWDDRVAEAVRRTCSAPVIQEAGRYRWFALHARWFVQETYYRRDLDNLRLKPVLDNLTVACFWPDDHVAHVRAIYNEACPAAPSESERLEVTVYGVP
jgi:Holliday junction resolvase RusA-like endonuclease